jgi:hypothetical protein
MSRAKAQLYRFASLKLWLGSDSFRFVNCHTKSYLKYKLYILLYIK